MLRVLRFCCSWSQISYHLSKNSVNRLNPAGNCANRTLSTAVQYIHSSYLKSLQARHREEFLCSLRSYGSFQEHGDISNAVEERTQGQIPVGVTMSKHRIEWQALFREIIANKSDSEWQSSDWESIAEKLSLPRGPKWDILCMHTLYKDKNLVLGRSLMDYLEQKAHPLSHITLTFYAGLLGETSNSSKQDEETKAVFDHLLKISDILDPASIEVLASGLSHTKFYRECVKLMEMCKEISTVPSSIIIDTLLGSIRFKDLDLLLSTLSMIEENLQPKDLAGYSAKLFKAGLSSQEEIFMAVMDFYKKHSLLLPLSQTEDIVNTFQELQPNKWHIQTSYIHEKTGRCMNCKHQMEKTEMTQAEFEAIQRAFLDQVIVGSNIFYKSSPEEVSHFIKFVKQTGPYDVVIDGMNVLHKQSKPKQPDVLYKAVKYFHDRGEKVLLLGSKVLTRYISNLKVFNPKPAIYLTSTTKADDSFFLYAALHSGRDTLIISRDKLRDHKFLMDPKLRHIFQQWLKRVQIYDWFFDRNRLFTIGRRHLHSIGPDRDEGGWHIPLNDIGKDYPFGNLTVLCLRDSSAAAGEGMSFRTQHDTIERKNHKIEHGTIERQSHKIKHGKKGQQRQYSKLSLHLEDLMKD